MDTLNKLLDQQEFIKSWAEKFNTLAHMATTTREGVASIVAGITQNFGAIQANLSAHSDAVEQLDVYNQIWAKMFLHVFEQLECAKYQYAGDSELIKVTGEEKFAAAFQECKATVLEEREAYVRHRQAQIEEQKMQAQTKTQDRVAEEALRSAEGTIISTPGGQGSAIPDGAEIFGG